MVTHRSFQQRHNLTEEEHMKLVQIGDLFWDAFSRLCAEHIVKMPPELHDATKQYLGDKTSIYGSKCEDFVIYIEPRRKK